MNNIAVHNVHYYKFSSIILNNSIWCGTLITNENLETIRREFESVKLVLFKTLAEVLCIVL